MLDFRREKWVSQRFRCCDVRRVNGRRGRQRQKPAGAAGSGLSRAEPSCPRAGAPLSRGRWCPPPPHPLSSPLSLSQDFYSENASHGCPGFSLRRQPSQRRRISRRCVHGSAARALVCGLRHRRASLLSGSCSLEPSPPILAAALGLLCAPAPPPTWPPRRATAGWVGADPSGEAVRCLIAESDSNRSAKDTGHRARGWGQVSASRLGPSWSGPPLPRVLLAFLTSSCVALSFLRLNE